MEHKCWGCGAVFCDRTLVMPPLAVCHECGCIMGFTDNKIRDLTDEERDFFEPIVETINQSLREKRSKRKTTRH